MKIKDLKNYGIPSCILDILGKNYSPYLSPVQKKAVEHYDILNYNNSDKTNPNPNSNPNPNPSPTTLTTPNNLLVISPPSSGKTLIAEMAVIAHTLHQKKAIYLVPFPFMAEDKYNHFNQLYTSFGLDIVISSQNQKENDKKITDENYDLAVIVYEKFNYFLSTYPDFLKELSLLIIDEIQIINDYQKACLLKSIINVIRNKKPDLKIIALSAFTSNCLSLKNFLSARLLTSLCHPAELRKGIVREGVFKYTEHNTKKRGKEVFFKAKAVRDNCFEDYLKETVNYFIHKNESTLLFFPTCQEAQKWAFCLSSHTNGPRANQAIDEFYQIKDTFSRKNLLILLEKGIAYYNSNLTRKEKKLIETYVRKGEIKVVCATTSLAIEINLTFKNVILQNNHRQSLSFIDIENIGGKAGILNKSIKDKTRNRASKKEKFGRLIFLAHNKLQEVIFKKFYFNLIDYYCQQEEEIFVENCLMGKPVTRNPQPETCNLPPTSCVSPPPRRDKTNVGVLLNTNNQRLTTILEIDIHRPDRIIFMGKNIEVTAKEFSLIHLLAQHNGQVMSYEDIIKKLWGAETEAIYTRIIQHIYKFRKNILDAIGHNKINREKVRDIFKVVPGRGVMLNINDTEIKIN